MNDCELLELAAKATGYGLGMWIDGEEPYSGGAGFIVDDILWNPLNSDGDALRLAVRLRLGIKDFAPTDGRDGPLSGFVEVWREEGDDPAWTQSYKSGHDRYAVTRRAIVRAAAEIGRAMP